MHTTIYTATDRQFSFIKNLLAERVLDSNDEAYIAQVRSLAVEGSLSAVGASSVIKWLQTLPRREQPAAPASSGKAEPGYYVQADGTFTVVVSNKAGTSTYAKELVTWTGDAGQTVARWDYAPGVGRTLAGLTPMTLEQAKGFGHAHGVCLVCCRTLTNPASVEAGIGPVCAAKF